MNEKSELPVDPEFAAMMIKADPTPRPFAPAPRRGEVATGGDPEWANAEPEIERHTLPWILRLLFRWLP